MNPHTLFTDSGYGSGRRLMECHAAPIDRYWVVAFDVDTDVFDDVLEAVGVEQVRVMVESVVHDIGHLMGHLGVGGDADALAAIGREAHHLGGGCRSIGFVSLGALCTRIEIDAREAVDHTFPAYAAELAQQRDALSDWSATMTGTRERRP
jgi:HPt (histidine-containing phosphotransfer) domain-containing protein